MITIIEAEGNKYAWLDVSRDKKGVWLFICSSAGFDSNASISLSEILWPNLFNQRTAFTEFVIRFMHRPRSTCFFALFLPILEFYVKSCAMEWTIFLVYVPFPDKTDVSNSFVNSRFRKLPWSSWFSPGFWCCIRRLASLQTFGRMLCHLHKCWRVWLSGFGPGRLFLNSFFLLEMSVIIG